VEKRVAVEPEDEVRVQHVGREGRLREACRRPPTKECEQGLQALVLCAGEQVFVQGLEGGVFLREAAAPFPADTQGVGGLVPKEIAGHARGAFDRLRHEQGARLRLLGRRVLERLDIQKLARRGQDQGVGPGSPRFRRLTVRHERRADIPQAFHRLAAGLICLGFVRRWFC
jgi:hypothetical protein